MTTASVVITNHDYAAYLGAAVDSALAQTEPDTEVVVVDDGSRDGSRELLAGYGDRIRLLCQPQRGQTAAMNRGFGASRGDVVIFLDADDVLEPTAAASAVTALAGGAAVKVHWPVATIDAAGAAGGAVLPASPLPVGELGDLAARIGPQNLSFPPTSGNAWWRSFAEQVFPLPEFEAELGVGSASADALLSMLAAFAGSVVALPEPLTRYRVHDGNDYARSPLGAQIDRHVATTDLHFPVVEAYARARGYSVDSGEWRRHSYFHRVQEVRSALRRCTPPSARILLVDDGYWGAALDETRTLVPFPQQAGEYWGPPADDLDAIRRLDQERSKGATHLAVAWPSFWWREVYPVFWRRLTTETKTQAHGPDVLLLAISESGDPLRS